MTNKLIVKDPFEMPAVDDTTVLVLRECADLVPHCWIWNESVGYLEVVTYSGYDIYVTVKNVGMKENATSGTIFPSCMEFLITAPNATPIIDNTVTCLRADFNCPTVGQEALMSVDSTSAIRVGDIIIVDTRYQYLVTEIINEHTMKVLNEEKGKESGVIDVKCNECVPVKILESTHCCEALQDQVDDIYSRIDTKKSVVSNNVLLSVAHGLDAISDVSYDIELDIDTDLSKYDNTTSAFITLGDVPALPSDTDLSHYDNSTSGFITSSSLPTVNDAQLTIYESDGVTPFVTFTANASSAVTATLPASGNTYTATSPISIDANNDISISQATTSTDGYLSSTDWNTFNNKASAMVYFEETLSGTTAIFQPKLGTATAFDLGSPTNYYDTEYTRNIYVKDLIPGETNTTIRFRPNSSTLTDIRSFAPYTGYTHCQLGTDSDYWNNGYINNIYTESFNAKGTSILVKSRLDSNNAGTSLGSSSANSFYEAWLQNIKTSQIKTISGTSVSVQADLNPGSNGSQSIGDTYYFNTIHGETIKVKYLTPGAGNAASIEVKTADNTGIVQLISNTATSNIGASNNNWSNGYFANLYGTDCFFNNVEPRASGNTGYVGKNTHYYSQMHCTTLQQHSDRKDKENIIERNSTKGVNIKSLDKINSLKTYTFNFKEGDNVRTHLGMMADEVYEVEPLCASLLEDDTPGSKSIEGTPTGIDIGAMITLLLEGIKELSSEVKELKSKLGEKDADNKVLEK